MQTIKFDDVPALTAKISKEFGPWSEPIHVTQEKINQFADVIPHAQPVARVQNDGRLDDCGISQRGELRREQAPLRRTGAGRRQRSRALAGNRGRAASDGHDGHARD